MSPASMRWLRRLMLGACLGLSAFYFAGGRWLMGCAWLALSMLPVLAGVPSGRRRYFALAAVLLSAVLTVCFVAGIDLYLHHRFAASGGYNIWGYRGPVAARKQPGERRLVMLGGSVAFGFGVRSDETIPYYLQQHLKAPGRPPISVINLGWNSEGAHSLKFTLKDYEYLDYDGAILYSGYNDLVFNNQVFRHESAIFRLTGYLPILPIVPIRQWLHLANLSETMGGRVVFRPTLSDRYATEAADTALRISQALDRELARFSPGEKPFKPAESTDPSRIDETCPKPWGYYCRSIRDAADVAIAAGKQVFIVTEPYKTDQHRSQQEALRSMVQRRFGTNPLVHLIDMGPSVDLTDRRLCYDGLHLTPSGNAQVAERLADELQRVVEPGA
jgi:hypothetical protein